MSTGGVTDENMQDMVFQMAEKFDSSIEINRLSEIEQKNDVKEMAMRGESNSIGKKEKTPIVPLLRTSELKKS